MSIQSHLSSDLVFINAYNLVPGVGAQKLFFLSRYFNSFADAWVAPRSELIAAGLSAKLATSVIKLRENIDPHTAWKKIEQANATLIIHTDPQFPATLRAIDSPPFCLYVRGNMSALSMPSVAIVGSRKISDYGVRATAYIAGDLARVGIAVVSGLALGTDIVAHRATLDNHGITVAVLAGGIDDASITPHSHYTIAQKIISSGGAIASEYPLGTNPTRGTFPARNRIMAGLTDATIIIEAAEKSGTLITADYASQFDKKIFALPGSIFMPNAYGPNRLISTGVARAVLRSDDIIDLFHKDRSKTLQQKDLPQFTNQEEEKIYTIIKEYPNGISINHIIKKSLLPVTTISSTLTMMEIGGIVRDIGNQTYVTTQSFAS